MSVSRDDGTRINEPREVSGASEVYVTSRGRRRRLFWKRKGNREWSGSATLLLCSILSKTFSFNTELLVSNFRSGQEKGDY